MSDEQEIRLTLRQETDYAFRIEFDGTGLDALRTDEPEPLGSDSGPNPSRLLLASVANCLCASLLFALRKYKNSPGPISAVIKAKQERNAEGRLRIPRAKVELRLAEAASEYQHLERILEQFEEFCVVTQSVRDGMQVDVQVMDSGGERLGAH
jgi:uncharacterized OsmC-like protein